MLTGQRMRNAFMKSEVKSFKLRGKYLVEYFVAIKKHNNYVEI